MRIVYTALVTTLVVVFVGCQSKTKPTESNQVESKLQVITFADFEKVKGVDNVQEVPFHLFTKLDSIYFYVAPSKDSANMRIGYDRMHNYYGFEEFEDFYAIHYSIQNNISNSIKAYVLKSEFTAAFDLTLEGADLYQIRSSTLKAVDDYENKSFKKFGTIVEVSAQEFTKAAKSKIDEQLLKNPAIVVKDFNWIYTENGEEKVISCHESVSTVDGMLYNTYVGKSAHLGLEIFKEYSEHAVDPYYAYYDLQSPAEPELYSNGYPHLVVANNWISCINSNNDVGSDFMISKYDAVSKQKNLLYINFTNFKIGDESKAFWLDSETFYAEVYPLNSASASGKKRKPAYLKIQLNKGLF